MMAGGYKVNYLATSVFSWLSYVSAIGRNFILKEDAIKFPACDYLSTCGAIDNVRLEFSHPKLSGRSADLFFHDRDTKINYLFEFKYIHGKENLGEEKTNRIFNDLMRLYFFLDNGKKGYFLICGDTLNWNGFFEAFDPPKNKKQKTSLKRKKKVRNPGFYDEWFSFDRKSPERPIDLNLTKEHYGISYKAFLNEYGDPFKKKTGKDLELPKTIKTKLIFLSETRDEADIKKSALNTSIPEICKLGIWEVTA